MRVFYCLHFIKLYKRRLRVALIDIYVKNTSCELDGRKNEKSRNSTDMQGNKKVTK